MFKRLICWIKGHRWCFFVLMAPNGDKVEYEVCSRCKKIKDELPLPMASERLFDWINEESHEGYEKYSVVGD